MTYRKAEIPMTLSDSKVIRPIASLSKCDFLTAVQHLSNAADAVAKFFVSERELTFKFSIFYRRSVCLSSVTLVRPTHSVKIFGNFSSPFGTLAIL